MILSASRRTDIPAFYGEWMMNRLRAGYVLIRNPYRRSQIHRIPLSPEVIDCIVFWTKDPQPFLPYLGELEQMGYRYYFQFTLNPYGRRIEPNLREKTEIAATFRQLSQRIGPQRVCWRYDPILLDGEYTIARHRQEFENYCGQLAERTVSVTISFLDLYRRNQKAGLRSCTEEEMRELAGMCGTVAGQYGMEVSACCEALDLTEYGVRKGSCIDRRRIEKICRASLKAERDLDQRPGCGCARSVDIGAYNTCPNGCLYCYATSSAASVLKNYRQHDPRSEFLCGSLLDGEIVIDKPACSGLQKQISL